jgi:hypothetical protein
MNTPLQNAAKITLNDPDLSVPLLDLLLWAVPPEFAETNEFSEIVDYLFMRSGVEEFHNARDAYVSARRAA